MRASLGRIALPAFMTRGAVQPFFLQACQDGELDRPPQNLLRDGRLIRVTDIRGPAHDRQVPCRGRRPSQEPVNRVAPRRDDNLAHGNRRVHRISIRSHDDIRGINKLIEPLKVVLVRFHDHHPARPFMNPLVLGNHPIDLDPS